jgi:phosphatidylglycerol lysyltransferase
MSHQILNPDIDLWFSAQGTGVIGYVSAHGYRVVVGAPVCPPDRLPEMVTRFLDDADRCGMKVCYFGAQQRLVRILERVGPAATLFLGAQPVWDPGNWSARVAAQASVRAQLARARNKGIVVRAWPLHQAAASSELARCLSDWLRTRGLPRMRFLLEPEALARCDDQRVFVAEREGRSVGYLVASPVPLRQGWLIEQIVRGVSAPNGTAELLLDAAMRDLAESGAAYATLGLSPLSSRSGIPLLPQPAWVTWLLRAVRLWGARFYNFDGLDSFKAKFRPERWEPIYAVANESRVSLRALYAIGGAFSGTSPMVFLLRAARRQFVRQQPYWSRRGPARFLVGSRSGASPTREVR